VRERIGAEALAGAKLMLLGWWELLESERETPLLSDISSGETGDESDETPRWPLPLGLGLVKDLLLWDEWPGI